MRANRQAALWILVLVGLFAAIPRAAGALDERSPLTVGPPRPVIRPRISYPPLDPRAESFGFESLYIKGAEVENVPDLKRDWNVRTLSMKVYTVQDDGGHPISMIGLVDITRDDVETPSMPHLFSPINPGYEDFTLIKRGEKFKLVVQRDGGLVLERPADKKDPRLMYTAIGQLYLDRNEQIVNSSTVTIAGRPYYVLVQGGATTSLLFFAKDQAPRTSGDMSNTHPLLMGDVAVRAADGSMAPITGRPDLGRLPDGSAWHLEFDMASNSWSVFPGAGDPKVCVPRPR